MSEQIKLTKIPHSKLKAIEVVIAEYIMSFPPEDLTDEVKDKLSIITAFYHNKLKSKVNSHFPSETHKLKFYFHEARVMVDAFLSYQNNHNVSELNYSIVENFKIDLYKQLM